MRRGMWQATAALALAVAAGAWMALWPCSFGGSTQTLSPDGTVTFSRTCASLVEMNGLWVIWLLLVPVAICLLGWDATRRGWRGVTMAFALVLLVFCVVTMWSVGFWFVPSAMLLALAAARMPRTSAAMAETS